MEYQEVLTPETEEIKNDLFEENNGAKTKKNYILKLNSIPYHFTIELSSNDFIIFELRQADKISYDYYLSKYNYDNILKLLNLEKNIYNNTLKVIELFDDLLKKEKIFIHKGDNKEKIELCIKLEQNSKEVKYFIYFGKKTMNEKKMMSIIIDEINEMRNNKSPKNYAQEIDEDVNNLEDELKNLDKEINQLITKKKQIQQKIDKNNNNAITNKSDYENEIIISMNIKNTNGNHYFFNSNVEDIEDIEVFLNGIKQGVRKSIYPNKTGLYTIKVTFKTPIKNCDKLFYYCVI